MAMRCWLMFATIVALVTTVLALTNRVKHSLKIEEKMKKAKSMGGSQPILKEYSGKFVMRFDGPKEDAEQLGKRHGFKKEEKPLKNLKRYLIFTDEQNRTRDQVEQVVVRMEKEDKRMKSFIAEERTHPTKLNVTPEPMLSFNVIPEPLLSFNVTDAHWSKQWHLHQATIPNLGVYDAWKKGYSGKGIVMAILDDGMDVEHTDLIDNYNESLSFNFIYDAPGGIHIHDDDNHGTMCAGLAVASKNDECIIGVAYETTVASFRILDEYASSSTAASALTHELDHIDIYSNSWGYPGYGIGFEPLHELEEAALLQGVMEGRNGKGAIYMFGVGNDGASYDDCNAAGLVNSIYTIGITAMLINGSRADYAEECTCIMAATYGGQGEYLMSTTDRHNKCTDEFLGTSAACPVAAGIVALTLQANPDLTWRDVQHLIAETSSHDCVPGEVFQTNGAGKNVSFTHGFGVMNADKIVKAALTWNTVPEKISCVVDTQSVYDCCTEVVKATYDVVNCPIKYLEHVQVGVSFEAIWREYMEIHIVSPNGTDSRLLRQRRLDSSSGSVEWTFMTVFNWGEDPTGTWTIRLDDFLNCDNEVHLYTWGLTLHGTVTDPRAGIPGIGTLGGRCDSSTPCTEGLDCLINFDICVDCNMPDYRVINGFCAQDKKTGGYCDTTLTCDADQSFCNENNTCEVCPEGFRRLDDQCLEDGKLDGYCGGYQECTEVDVGCNWAMERCIICDNGYHVIYGYCTEDGTLYGYCDENVTCDTANTEACSPYDNLCTYCDTDYGQRIINGFCFDDGTMRGYCNESVTCTEAGTGCDLELNSCTECENDGYRIVDSVCRLDGVLLGYCNDTITCQDGSGCDPELNVCVECKSFGYRVVGNGFCKEDGQIDGYCDASVKCTSNRTGCSGDNNICVICYAGHHLYNGFCVQGKKTDEVATEDKELKKTVEDKAEDKGLSDGFIAGSLVGGVAAGIAITAPVFVLMFKKLSIPNIYTVSQNTAYDFSKQKQ